jgi:hypothetical protein
MSTPMTFAEAAKRQHLYGSYYTIWLVSPEGKREYIGFTGRKSGAGLFKFLQRDTMQSLMKRRFLDVASLSFKKTATALILSNGWKIEFGGTIRQEASEQNCTSPTESFESTAPAESSGE